MLRVIVWPLGKLLCFVYGVFASGGCRMDVAEGKKMLMEGMTRSSDEAFAGQTEPSEESNDFDEAPSSTGIVPVPPRREPEPDVGGGAKTPSM